MYPKKLESLYILKYIIAGMMNVTITNDIEPIRSMIVAAIPPIIDAPTLKTATVAFDIIDTISTVSVV